MRRREFITLIGGAAAAWPIVARGQQLERRRRIGILIGTAEAEFHERVRPFLQGLQELGWTYDRDIRIDARWTSNDRDLARAYAAELVGLAPDVIFASPGPAIDAVQRETPTIPIVFVTSSNPVQAGYVQSFARPGGNLTGFISFEATITTKFLQLLKDIAPTVKRVAIVRTETVVWRGDFEVIEAVSRSFGITPVAILVRDDADDLERKISAFAGEPNGGLVVLPDNVLSQHRDLIVMLAGKHRLPAIFPYRQFVDAGGLMSYGVDQFDIYRRAASYVDRILKGEKPADLPVQAPIKFELVIQLKTATALGLSIPPPLFALADEVIE
jgi:putative ABC transport system substrate-binding protein